MGEQICSELKIESVLNNFFTGFPTEQSRGFSTSSFSRCAKCNKINHSKNECHRTVKSCYICHKKGHTARDCIYLLEEENETVLIWCYKCGRIGHTSPMCCVE